MDSPPSAPPSVEQAFELALLSDVGTSRPDNEDSCGHFIESPDSVVFAVADGVGGYEGGEIASRMGVDILLQAYRESPPAWGAAKRLYRAITRANIEIHDKALTVPELSRMATTMTAVAVEKGILAAVHIGDCRLHLIRHSQISVVTKDHTMVAGQVRMGMMTAARAKTHPERGMLLRNHLGQFVLIEVFSDADLAHYSDRHGGKGGLRTLASAARAMEANERDRRPQRPNNPRSRSRHPPVRTVCPVCEVILKTAHVRLSAVPRALAASISLRQAVSASTSRESDSSSLSSRTL